MNYAGQFFVGDDYSIMNLGHFRQNEDIRIRVTIANDYHEAYWCDTLFYSFDKDAFVKSAERIQGKTAEITDMTNTSVTMTCTAEEEDSCLFTTIPYEPGWNVTVNGAPVAVSKCADALMTVPLRKGQNEVKMVFDPDYYKIGKAMTAGGVIIILLIFLFEFKNGKLIAGIFGRKKEKAQAEAEEQEEHDPEEQEEEQAEPQSDTESENK